MTLSHDSENLPAAGVICLQLPTVQAVRTYYLGLGRLFHIHVEYAVTAQAKLRRVNVPGILVDTLDKAFKQIFVVQVGDPMSTLSICRCHFVRHAKLHSSHPRHLESVVPRPVDEIIT